MTVLDVSAIVEALADQAITIENTAAGTIDSMGRFVPGAATMTAVALASVQPVAGKQILRPLEGVRTRTYVHVYTPGVALRAPDPENSLAGSVVIDAAGIRYRATLVEDWVSIGGYGFAECVQETPP